MKKDFFKDSKIKFPAYEPWISGDDKKIINKYPDNNPFRPSIKLLPFTNIAKQKIVKNKFTKLFCNKLFK